MLQLNPGVHYWVVPPIPLIDATLLRLKEAKVMATVVVPLWKRQPWYAWLQQHAVWVERLEWQDWPATFLDVSEKKAKPHVVNRWQFGAAMLDFRAEGQQPKGRAPVWDVETSRPRKKPCWRGDVSAIRGQKAMVPVQAGQQKRAVSMGARVWTRPWVVLSLCDGMSAVAMALQQLGVLHCCFKQTADLITHDQQVCSHHSHMTHSHDSLDYS